MPIDPVWCYEMASYYMVKLDFKEAIQYFEMASTLMGGYEYKSDTVYSPHLFQGKMQIQFGHGYSKCLFSLGRYEEAIIVEHAWSIYFNQEYGGRTSSTCSWATCDYMRGTFREKYLDGEYGTQDDITIEFLALCSTRNPSPSATTCEAYRREPRFARHPPPPLASLANTPHCSLRSPTSPHPPPRSPRPPPPDPSWRSDPGLWRPNAPDGPGRGL